MGSLSFFQQAIIMAFPWKLGARVFRDLLRQLGLEVQPISSISHTLMLSITVFLIHLLLCMGLGPEMEI